MWLVFVSFLESTGIKYPNGCVELDICVISDGYSTLTLKFLFPTKFLIMNNAILIHRLFNSRIHLKEFGCRQLVSLVFSMSLCAPYKHNGYS